MKCKLNRAGRDVRQTYFLLVLSYALDVSGPGPVFGDTGRMVALLIGLQNGAAHHFLATL